MSGTEPETSTAGVAPAPYGRACTNCARAKCRCIIRIDTASCERCLRLKKDCVPSVTVRKRNGRRQVGSRTAHLEEKLEDLVTLLRNQNGTVVKTTPSTSTATTETTTSTTSHGPSPLDMRVRVHTPAPSHGSQTDPAPSGYEDRSGSNPAGRTPTAPPGSAGAGLPPIPGLFNHQPPVSVPIASMIEFPHMPATEREAEEHLLFFRDRYLECFPCFYIPPGTTSAQLRREKPFSWFTMMMVSCQSSAMQFSMGDIWRKIIAQKIVVEHEKNMDVLQGMIIMLAWSQYYKKDKPYLSIFSQLALSQVYDLMLNKPHGDSSVLYYFKALTFAHVQNKERTMEDRRTVLACFYITSQISYSLRKMEGLRWTAHMNECLAFLSEHPEWPGDALLAAQVRIQLAIDQMGSDAANGSPASLPAYYKLSSLTLPLDTVKKQLPPGLENNEMIRIQLIYAELALLENGLGRTPFNPDSPDLRRYELLSRTAVAIRQWFDIFFSLCQEFYTGISFAVWSQLAHCMMSLYRLTVLDEPAWDRSALRRDLDLLQVCDRVIRDMEKAGACRRNRRPELAGTLPQQPVVADEDIFTTCTRMIMAMRNVWASELGSLQMGAADPADKIPDETGFVDNVAAGPALAAPINFLDEAWLTDIFNVSWE